MKKIRSVLLISILMLSMAGLIVYSENVTEAVTMSIKRCISIIIPSLFAFMAISGYLIHTGVIGSISTPLDKTVGRLLKMPAGTTAIFLISNTAGYPVGASMLADAVRNGKTDRRSAEATAVYCYAGGPAYLINTIGAGIFECKAAGVSVFLSILTSNVILAAVINRIYKPQAIVSSANTSPSADDLIRSVTEAGEKIFDMCLMIIWFSAMLAAAEGTGLPAHIGKTLGINRSEWILIRSLFEVTSSSALDQHAYGMLPFLAAICSFGGLCVIFQLAAVIKNSYGIKLFLKWMPIRMLLVFGMNKLYNWIFLDNDIPVFAQNKQLIVELDNLTPSLCLIMMIFILVLKKRLDFFKRV